MTDGESNGGLREEHYGKTANIWKHHLPPFWSPERENHRAFGLAPGPLSSLRRLRETVDLARVDSRARSDGTENLELRTENQFRGLSSQFDVLSSKFVERRPDRPGS